LLVANTLPGGLRFVDCQAGGVAGGVECQPLGPLNPLERTADRIGFYAQSLQLSAGVKVVAGFIRTARPGIDQAAEVIGPRIAAATLDGGGQKLMSPRVVAGEEGVHAPPI